MAFYLPDNRKAIMLAFSCTDGAHFLNVISLSFQFLFPAHRPDWQNILLNPNDNPTTYLSSIGGFKEICEYIVIL